MLMSRSTNGHRDGHLTKNEEDDDDDEVVDRD